MPYFFVRTPVLHDLTAWKCYIPYSGLTEDVEEDLVQFAGAMQCKSKDRFKVKLQPAELFNLLEPLGYKVVAMTFENRKTYTWTVHKQMTKINSRL